MITVKANTQTSRTLPPICEAQPSFHNAISHEVEYFQHIGHVTNIGIIVPQFYVNFIGGTI